jgi:hypothetical protein
MSKRFFLASVVLGCIHHGRGCARSPGHHRRGCTRGRAYHGPCSRGDQSPGYGCHHGPRGAGRRQVLVGYGLDQRL